MRFGEGQSGTGAVDGEAESSLGVVEGSAVGEVDGCGVTDD